MDRRDGIGWWNGREATTVDGKATAAVACRTGVATGVGGMGKASLVDPK